MAAAPIGGGRSRPDRRRAGSGRGKGWEAWTASALRRGEAWREDWGERHVPCRRRNEGGGLGREEVDRGRF